ncbi:MAG: peptidase [Candidatus Roseilinea sp.]|nr:MAG: peptidase [Candidatus Roseilinea sp.]
MNRMAALCIAPYGTWKSRITADAIARRSVSMGQVTCCGEAVYWVESRPAEGGRYALVRWRNGFIEEVTPAWFNVRTRVHEYGGGAYVVHDGAVYCVHFADQRLYRVVNSTICTPLTPESQGRLRYADAVIDARRRRLICVREDHTAADREAVNTIVGVSCDGDPGGGQVLVAGHDFYAAPRLSPDGSRLAWLAWNHPNMPWDGCELWLAEVLPEGGLANSRCIAGGARESIFQPEWSPDGTLHFVSDRTGWWNLYCWRNDRAHALCPTAAEFGVPAWVLGQRTYAFIEGSHIICTYVRDGQSYLALLNSQTGALHDLALPYTAFSDVSACDGAVAFRAGGTTEPPAIVRYTLANHQQTVLRRAGELPLPPDDIAIGQPIAFPTEDGETAYGFFYPPHNRAYSAPRDERPPLLVLSHGGPTGATNNALNLKIQFWTSRGIAVLDVNYGGSTGYGRAYRERLNGQWGIVDVHDCLNGARYLIAHGLVDDKRLMIAGGSAGGFTTLCALTFHTLFKAGASYYGVSDAEALARDTHKFESHYLDTLIGPYPERRDLYVQRSPIHFADRISAPLILFQGSEDVIVPPQQSAAMFEAVRRKGLPTALLMFEGEQHGFRKAESIKRALEAELSFYAQVFGFTPADPLTPVQMNTSR